MDSNAVRLPAFLFLGVAAILAMSAIFGGGSPAPARGADGALDDTEWTEAHRSRVDRAEGEAPGQGRFESLLETLPFGAHDGGDGDSYGGAYASTNRDPGFAAPRNSTGKGPSGFLAANHDLILPPPNPTLHTWNWEDDRTQIVFERCKAIARDPSINPDAFTVRTLIDFDALAAIEDHFGFLPDDVFTLHRADGDDRDYAIDRVTEPAYRAALAKHGIILEHDRIRVDFTWLTSRSALHLRPLAEAVVKSWRASATVPVQNGTVQPGNGPVHDARIEALTSFVQRAIPYESIPATTGDVERCGLRSPGPTLLRGGDCDSKAVLLSALIRAVDSEIPLVMVSLSVNDRPHVLLGVGIPADPCSAILDHRGVRYVLIEVTSAIGVGVMAPDYNAAVFEHFAVIR